MGANSFSFAPNRKVRLLKGKHKCSFSQVYSSPGRKAKYEEIAAAAAAAAADDDDDGGDDDEDALKTTLQLR